MRKSKMKSELREAKNQLAAMTRQRDLMANIGSEQRVIIGEFAEEKRIYEAAFLMLCGRLSAQLGLEPTEMREIWLVEAAEQMDA